MTRFVIIGAGAVGGVFSVELFAEGNEVLLVARGPQLEAIRAGGLQYVTAERRERFAISVVGHPREVEFRSDDVVIVATKSQDTAAALDDLSLCADPETPIVCAQNGVDNERAALRRFSNVYAMSVMVPSLYLEAGVVAAHSAPVTGVLHLGRYPSGSDELATELQATFDKTNLMAFSHPDIQRWKYAKLLSNLGNVARAILADGADGVVAVARAEGEAVLLAAGIEHVSEEEFVASHVPITARSIEGIERGLGSTWQSLRRRAGSTETDYLNGEVVLMGRLHGVATPINTRLQEFADRAVVEELAPCTVPLAEFNAHD